MLHFWTSASATCRDQMAAFERVQSEWAAQGWHTLMVDCDHLGMMHTFMNGLDLSENGLAGSAFNDAGPGQHFLGTGHTLANYETAYCIPVLSDSESFEARNFWVTAGSRNSRATRASALR